MVGGDLQRRVFKRKCSSEELKEATDREHHHRYDPDEYDARRLLRGRERIFFGSAKENGEAS